MSDTTPTVSELLNAANWEYQQIGNPADLTPFLVNGQQLSMTNRADGMSGSAWLTPKGQVVVSFLGTQFVSLAALAADPTFSFRQLLEDVGVASGDVTAGEKDAAAFARQVVQAAAARGISSDNVFVTGHSLGAIQAEYAAQQTGLGGIGFEPTGIPRSSTSAGTGANFVNVVQNGDSVANYSSDIDAEQPFSPTYVPGGAGALPHYGYVAMIGDPSAEAALKAEAALSNGGDAGLALTTAAYGGQLAAFHLPNVQAYNLGVTLTQFAATELVGARSGPVLDAANLTIPELIQATKATLSASQSPDPSVSPTTGPYAGAAASFLTGSNGSVVSALAPSIIGAATALTVAGTDTLPFAHVTVTDPNPNATDTLIITLASGALTDGAGFDGLRSVADGIYALSGAPAAITSELAALRFTASDAAGAVGTAYTLVNGSSAGTSAVSSGTIPASLRAGRPTASTDPVTSGASVGTSSPVTAGTTATQPSTPVVADNAATSQPSPPVASGGSGAGATPASTVSINPTVTYAGGTFTVSGTASSAAGVRNIELFAQVDGVRTDLGAATVGANGTFTFSDAIGPRTQSFITATETDGMGGTATTGAGFSLTGGLGIGGTAAEQDSYSADGTAVLSRITFQGDGSSVTDVGAPGQTVELQPYGSVSNHRQANTTFVFDPGDTLSVVNGFQARGAGHDTLSLSSVDFGNSLATVLLDTVFTAGGATIFDPVTNDIVRLANVTKAQLVNNPGDIAFHG